jgi:hypothetical protein
MAESFFWLNDLLLEAMNHTIKNANGNEWQNKL